MLGEGLHLWEGRKKKKVSVLAGREVSQRLGIIPGQEKLRDAERHRVAKLGTFAGPPAGQQRGSHRTWGASWAAGLGAGGQGLLRDCSWSYP